MSAGDGVLSMRISILLRRSRAASAALLSDAVSTTRLTNDAEVAMAGGATEVPELAGAALAAAFVSLNAEATEEAL